MYKIGSFFGQLNAGVREGLARDVDEALAKGREHGIVELDFNSKEINDDTNAMLARAGMQAASVHGFAPLEFDTREKYIASLDYMKNAINKAVSIGSPYFMNVPQIPAGLPAEKQGDYVKALREQFHDLCEYAKDLPITVTVEDFSVKKSAYASIEDIKYLLDNNPTLMFTYDSGNFPLAGVDEIEGLKAFIDRVVYVHLKDLKVTDGEGLLRDGVVYDSLELGGGFVKNAEAMKIINASGWTHGTVTVEVNSEFDIFKRTIESADWLADLIAKL